MTSLDARSLILARLLVWQREMGADAVVGGAPVDWLGGGGRVPGQGYTIGASAPAGATAEEARTGSAPSTAVANRPPRQLPQAPPPTAAPPARTFPAATGSSAYEAARDAAGRAASLEALAAELERFDGCALKATAKSLCFYRGAVRARLMIIGEAPGREEDLAGKPFVGRAGQLLDRMLAAIDLTEADVHITNTVYWRPPGNRQPTPQEMLVCRPFLDRQIELVAPDIILLMGGIAAGSLLDTALGITRLRGRWTKLDRGAGLAIRTLPTLHPAYLLRSPAAKRQAWHDLRMIRSALVAAR